MGSARVRVVAVVAMVAMLVAVVEVCVACVVHVVVVWRWGWCDDAAPLDRKAQQKQKWKRSRIIPATDKQKRTTHVKK